MNNNGVRSILIAAGEGQTGEALTETTALLRDQPDCPYLLVWRAILIQVQDPAGPHTLDEAEACLLRAHATDPNYLPALEELAHYYDSVNPDLEKARAFAYRYIEKAQKALDEMRRITGTLT